MSGMVERVAFQLVREFYFAGRKLRGREPAAAEQLVQMVGRPSLGQDLVRDQQCPAVDRETAGMGEPPAQPRMAAQHAVNGFGDGGAVFGADEATGAEEGADHGICRTRGHLHLVEEFDCGLKAGAGGHLVSAECTGAKLALKLT